MDVLLTVAAGILGLAIGSFLNVCIDRLPRGESIVTRRSYCEACGRRLPPGDLVPVLSYLVLRGRCRSCGAHIPLRVLIVELLTGIAFAAIVFTYSLTPVGLLLLLYTCILVVVFFTDLEQGLILNIVVYPSIIIALLAALTVEPWWLGRIGPIPLVSAALGAVTGFVFLFVVAVASRGGMGWGDVKFAAFMGAAVGFPLILVALFTGIVVGGATGAVLLLSGRKSRRQAIPFGPFLAIGTMVTLLWGQQMLEWYLALM